MANDPSSGAASVELEASASTRLPLDILILATVAAQLWSLTAIWLALDVGGKLDGVEITETDAWLLALSGLMFVVLAILPIILIWSKLLAAVTGLLVLNLLLRRFPLWLRWGISLIGASLLVLVTGSDGTGQGGHPGPPTSPIEEGMPSRADIATRERELAARCLKPSNPDIIAYCRARDDVLRLLNDPG